MRRDTGSEITSIDYDPVSHELVSFVRRELMHARPESAECGERFWSIGARVDKNGFVIQRAQAGIEVIAVAVDEPERNDRDIQLGHGTAEFRNPTLGRTKSITGVNAGPVRVPEKVAVTFQVVVTKFDIDNLEAAPAIPIHIELHFALP